MRQRMSLIVHPWAVRQELRVHNVFMDEWIADMQRQVFSRL